MGHLSRKLMMDNRILLDRCLACAVDTGQTAGIWGGRAKYQRKLMRQGRYRYELVPREAARRRP